MSQMSFRKSGSPPVRIRKTFGLTRAISSITRRHSSVDSSPRVSAPANADMQQCEHSRLHRRVRFHDTEYAVYGVAAADVADAGAAPRSDGESVTTRDPRTKARTWR